MDVAAKVFGVILLKRFQPERDQRTHPAEGQDMGYHDQDRPGTELRIASLWLRTMEKGLGERV